MIPCDISDHDLIFMTKQIGSPKSKFAPRIINIGNQHDILHNIPFDEIKATCKDADEIWLQWKTFFLDILDKHMPNTQIKIKGNRIPHVNSDVKEIRQKGLSKSKSQQNGVKYLETGLLPFKKQSELHLEIAKKNYYTNKTEENKDNLKKTWQILREAMGQGGKISSVDKVIVDGITVTDKEQIPDIFNDHLVSVGSKIADNIPATDLSPTVNIPKTQNRFKLKQITNAQIIKIVKKLVNGKAIGIHNIPNKVLKDSIDI